MGMGLLGVLLDRPGGRSGSLLGMAGLSLRKRRDNARGFSHRTAAAWRNRRFLSVGAGNRAAGSFGTGNSAFRAFARTPGTGGNAITFRIVVSGASTVQSVAVVGSAVTFNSATSAGSAATSTVNDMIRAVNSDSAARPLIHLYKAAGSDGTGVVAAVAATALSGAA